MQKHIYNFTHNDLDGVGCYIVLKACLHEKVKVNGFFCSYKNINSKVKEFIENKEYEKYVKVIISDISVNAEVAEMINSLKPNNFILFDHHQTALELNKYTWCNVSEEENKIKQSGTSIVYDYIKNKNINIDNFVELVRSYDTWDWEKTGNIKAKDLNNIFQILGMFDFANFYSKSIIEKNKFEIDELHKKMLYYKKKEIELYIKRKQKDIKILIDNKNNKFAFCAADYNISELANNILDEYKDIKYCLIFYGSGFSMRSKGNIDISKICKLNNGGGHKNAGAFNIDYDWYKELLSNIKMYDESLEFSDEK